MQRLGTQLLRRTTRHLSLTDEGRLVYDRAKTILSELQEMEMTLSANRSEPSGRLRVSAPVPDRMVGRAARGQVRSSIAARASPAGSLGGGAVGAADCAATTTTFSSSAAEHRRVVDIDLLLIDSRRECCG